MSQTARELGITYLSDEALFSMMMREHMPQAKQARMCVMMDKNNSSQ